MTADVLPHRYHDHVFDEGNPLAERNTRWTVLLTAIMMVAEITSGWLFNSMALLADGWHMSSHALALGLSVAAYAAARRFAQHPGFAFGTWKIEVLGGYTSAIFLVGIAGLMFYQSIERLIAPTPIQYNQAILVAILGLGVNLICAWLLKDGHHHHSHGEDHQDHGHHHHDLNLRAAYLHVLTDALTSLLAIIALFGGKLWGANWLDPVMGIAGAALVSIWAIGLIRETGKVLLDAEMNKPIANIVKQRIDTTLPEVPITDLHLWRVGKQHYACILSVSAEDKLTPDHIKACLSDIGELAHITIEVNRDAKSLKGEWKERFNTLTLYSL
ncbi:CDF family Co(II)/Ni(II) efflux transporter DmeF [Congregibacter litoralis]|uniref:Cation diffusion facilitator family transporter n=1 Tax=Congregibacter litoralis KT71 TaxID=314285 RepID=A4A4A1_9GAMM|nr:CDF family Co(II)/Ni(II) efflux transporter DmeF [Congregibacter litoralis]EAQ99524.1 cation diffusion facilitator family transporter [Congregibacter litoralis KT71]